MAEIVRRRSWGGVLPLGRHASISGSSVVHCASENIAPPLSKGAKRPQTHPVQARTGPKVGRNSTFETIVSVALPGARGPDAMAGIVDRRLAALWCARGMTHWESAKHSRPTWKQHWPPSPADSA